MGAGSVGYARFSSGQYDLWHVPRVWNPRRPLVVYMAGGVDTPLTAPLGGVRPVVEALEAEGFVTVQCAVGTGGAAWGNATAMTRITEAIAYGRANLGCTFAPIVVMGTSGGGYTALQYARQNTVAACVTFIAPVDLNYIRDNDVASTRAGIDAAFGVTWSAPGVEALPAHADLWSDSAAYVGKPIQMWTSSNDTLNNPAQTQQAWATTIGAEWHDLGAVGHSYTSTEDVDPATVVDFVLARV